MTRAERRQHWDNAKRRAIIVWRRWHKRSGDEPELCAGWSYNNGRRVYRVYTPRELAAGIAHIAETHGRPCSCSMCAHHKEVPPPRERSAMAYVRDYDIEVAQEQEAEERYRVAAMHEECDEIQMAFGHDLHRHLLMTAQQIGERDPLCEST